MVGVLGEIDQVIAQEDRVLQLLVVQRARLDARDPEGRRDTAERDDETVVVDHALGQVDPPCVEVDALDAIAPEAEPPAPPDIADRLHDVPGLDERGGHLRQQWREQQVVLVTDQEDLDVETVAQPPLEDADRLHAAEAAAEHDDARHTSSTPRGPATISPISNTVSPAAASAARVAGSSSGGRTRR